MPEQEPKPTFLPTISEETRSRLIEELGLNKTQKDRRILTGLTGERQHFPFELIEVLEVNVFSDLAVTNRELVEVINSELKTFFKTRYLIDDFVVGMALVLRAYDINSEHNLIPKLGNLGADDFKTVRNALENSLSGIRDSNILERALNAPRIPEQQVNLNFCVEEAVNASGAIYKNQIRLGAAMMFRLLQQLWPKLELNKTTDQSQNRQNLVL